MKRARILLVEDDAELASALSRVLSDEQYEVVVLARGDQGLATAQAQPFDIVLTDLRLPGLNGLELVRQLHAHRPRLPIILMTAHGTTETAIEATKLGAYDYLLKPFEMEELLDLVSKAVESSRLMSEGIVIGDASLAEEEGLSEKEEVIWVTAEPAAAARNAIIGNSRLMQNLYKEVGRVAAKPVPVLIRGETGTGKELIARALYQYSDRAGAPFVAVNCAAIPETLLESELFGHERGAFTGAENRRIGRFEQAHGGTLFLDEIGDLSLSTQIKLLRVLQEKCVQRLGSKETMAVDVRVIAATHRDLEAAMAAKSFREDLFYRLSVVVLTLPLLRQRAEDIPALVKYFLRRYGAELGMASSAIRREAVEFLLEQAWPGNVRELENVVRQALVRARGYPINLDHVRQTLAKAALPAAVVPSLTAWIAEFVAAAKRGETEDVHRQVIAAVERELFAQTIEQAQSNQAKAARWLGVSRLTMREKLQRFGLHPGQTEGPAPDR